MCVEAECRIKTVGAWEKNKNTKHTCTLVHPHVSFACAGKMKKRPLQMVATELKTLAHNIISLHLWGVDLSWMADYSLPALLSSPHEACSAFTAMHGCLTHLTPVIIAFRPVTGRISIHSGWDLFFGGVGWRWWRWGPPTKLMAPVWTTKKIHNIIIYNSRSYLSRCSVGKLTLS